MILIEKAEEYINLLSRGLNQIGIIGIFLMSVITIVDTVGSKVFSRPLFGSDEILGAVQIVTISSGIAFTQILHGHTEVDFFAEKMGKGMEKVIKVFVPFAGLILVVLLSWYLYRYGQGLRISGEVSSNARLPLYPLAYYMAFCLAVMGLVLIIELIGALCKIRRTI